MSRRRGRSPIEEHESDSEDQRAPGDSEEDPVQWKARRQVGLSHHAAEPIGIQRKLRRIGGRKFDPTHLQSIALDELFLEILFREDDRGERRAPRCPM